MIVLRNTPETQKPNYPYLATHKGTGALCLVSRHCVIVIESSSHAPGDAWIKGSYPEENFTPLPLGDRVTLVNS